MKKKNILLLSIAVILVVASLLILNNRLSEQANEKLHKELADKWLKEEKDANRKKDSLQKIFSERLALLPKTLTDQKYYWAGQFEVYISMNNGPTEPFIRLEEYQFKSDGTVIEREQTKSPRDGQLGTEIKNGKWALDESTATIHIAWSNSLTDEMEIVDINQDMNQIRLNRVYGTFLPILHRKPLLDKDFTAN
ncbi:hypothetical protein [Elizabethkingia meningoseptica]|uniref:hypothetical protein n=1 Tax=Elizabethkingia meningoseptica TaxID=238 RepID=UPI002DD623B4|nr:hypothetical protein [Elizabethkingia meningoseptica]MEC4712398.1 hypothetical protein [Elizabethkingia meningoseptica]